MFGKLMARLRTRGATAETTLETGEADVGGVFGGRIEIKGGSRPQTIRSVVVQLKARALVEISGEKVPGEIIVAEAAFEAGEIEADGEAWIEFEMEVPDHAPITAGSTQLVVETYLKIGGVLEHAHTCDIHVHPSPAMAAILNGVIAAGFDLAEAEVEHRPGSPVQFLQEFDFVPSSHGDWGIEEVEIALAPMEGATEVHLTVDSRGGLFFGGTERTARFILRDEELEGVDMGMAIRQAIDSLA